MHIPLDGPFPCSGWCLGKGGPQCRATLPLCPWYPGYDPTPIRTTIPAVVGANCPDEWGWGSCCAQCVILVTPDRPLPGSVAGHHQKGCGSARLQAVKWQGNAGRSAIPQWQTAPEPLAAVQSPASEGRDVSSAQASGALPLCSGGPAARPRLLPLPHPPLHPAFALFRGQQVPQTSAAP